MLNDANDTAHARADAMKALIRRPKLLGWFEEYGCGCISETVKRRKDLLGYCGQHEKIGSAFFQILKCPPQVGLCVGNNRRKRFMKAQLYADNEPMVRIFGRGNSYSIADLTVRKGTPKEADVSLRKMRLHRKEKWIKYDWGWETRVTPA